MKKTISILIFSFFAFSCSDNMIITNNSIGDIKLGNTLKGKYDTNELEIILDENNLVRTIIINSQKYKTKDGFGVGSNINNIHNKYNKPINEKFGASKGAIQIIDLGRNIIQDKIIFVDNNKDDKINYVILSKD